MRILCHSSGSPPLNPQPSLWCPSPNDSAGDPAPVIPWPPLISLDHSRFQGNSSQSPVPTGGRIGGGVLLQEAEPGPCPPVPAYLGPAAGSSAAPAAAGAAVPTSSSTGDTGHASPHLPAPPPFPPSFPAPPARTLSSASTPTPPLHLCAAGLTGGLSPWLFGSETRPGPRAR